MKLKPVVIMTGVITALVFVAYNTFTVVPPGRVSKPEPEQKAIHVRVQDSNYTVVKAMTLDAVDLTMIVDTTRPLTREENFRMTHAMRSILATTMFEDYPAILEEMPTTMKFFSIPVSTISVYLNRVTFKVSDKFIEEYRKSTVDLSE